MSEPFLILKIQRYFVINVHTSSCKVPLLLSDFYDTWIFSKDFRKILTDFFKAQHAISGCISYICEGSLLMCVGVAIVCDFQSRRATCSSGARSRCVRYWVEDVSRVVWARWLPISGTSQTTWPAPSNFEFLRVQQWMLTDPELCTGMWIFMQNALWKCTYHVTFTV